MNINSHQKIIIVALIVYLVLLQLLTYTDLSNKAAVVLGLQKRAVFNPTPSSDNVEIPLSVMPFSSEPFNKYPFIYLPNIEALLTYLLVGILVSIGFLLIAKEKPIKEANNV